MQPSKLQIKFFVAQNGHSFELEPFVPLFHDWIRRNALGEVVLDVADYGHVHHGPGVVLVGHYSDYALDLGEGRPGLLYNRKRDTGDSATRVRDAFRKALRACVLVEQDAAARAVKFRTDEVLFRVNDRLRAPNDAGSFQTLKAELEPFAKELFGAGIRIEQHGAPSQLLTLKLSGGRATSVSDLLGRLGNDAS